MREALNLCGIKRRFLSAQKTRLHRETAQALREARRLGSPDLPLSEAARIAGVSRSVAYATYLGEEGDDGSSDSSDPDDDAAVA